MLSFLTDVVVRFGPVIVGAMFLWTGALKALAPQSFEAHLLYLEIPGRPSERWLTRITAGLEGAWGVTLILGIGARVTYPVTAALLLVLAGVTWWSVSSGRTDDCGCYAGMLTPSLSQSMLMNGLMASLCILSWIAEPAYVSWSVGRMLLVVTIAIVFSAITAVSQRLFRERGRALLDVNPLRVNERWNNSWAAGGVTGTEREVMIAFMAPDCPFCREFVKVGNAVTQTPGMPSVIGVFAASPKTVQALVQEYQIRFRVFRISNSLMKRLVTGFPTMALVRNGLVEELWPGRIPSDFVDRFKRALFPAPVSASHSDESSREAS
jgi:hypothetical protein